MFWKKKVPLIIVFIMGFVMAVQYFIPHEYSKKFYDTYID